MAERYDAVVIGGGPAGLSCALNLVRARQRVLVLDSNRPRHSATLVSHGFLTRDGVSPLELRRLGREDVTAYENGEVAFATVSSIAATDHGFALAAAGVRGEPDRDVIADRVIIATGLSEKLPAIAGLRAFYGTSIHSCFECDGFEKRDEPLLIIGETEDLARRAQQATLWSRDVIAFSNGSDRVPADAEASLAGLGVHLERRPIAELFGERGALLGVRLEDGTEYQRSLGFVRPEWSVNAPFLDALDLDRGDHGLIVTDAEGRASVPGVYAIGDVTPPGPQQLIVAAGSGAHTAAAVLRDVLDTRITAGNLA